jgi:VWFA-related protein
MKGSGLPPSRLRRFGAPGATGASAILFLVVSGFSPTVQTQAPPQPTFRTEANYVRVDVFPTHDGAPVTDLALNDFELREGNAPQKIDQFEHVTIQGTVAQEMRREPNTVAESRAAMQDPRARVFVVFLDIGHVDVGGSNRIRQPLVDALNHLIGENDLVALMTPEMSALDLTFARKTTTIEGLLARHWTWGERDALIPNDPVEQNYESCFGTQQQSALTRELIARRREKQTIDALQDLVRYLRRAREERKAVITITDGWVLYTPNPSLENYGADGGPGININPGTGKLQIGDANKPGTISGDACTRDLMMLARIDDALEFRTLLDEANTANTSFYPLDPRGLPVFDSSIAQPLPLRLDQAMLSQRADTLRTLAENTDGLAMLNNNDLSASFRKIVADLSSYYLLGYYSSGKLDGKFHSISVRVKRPGVQVRARRGYMALTPAEAASFERSASAGNAAGTGAGGGRGAGAEPSTSAAVEARAVETAISPLSGYTRDVPLRLQVAAGWTIDDAASAMVSVEGELGPAAIVGDSWGEGFDVTATLMTAADVTVATGRVSVLRGARTFRVVLTASQPIPAGAYQLRVGARAGPASIPARDIARVEIPAAPASVGAIYVRRGPSTGNREVPTADLRFRRSEQVRVEVPFASADPVTARLLDRTGKTLSVPVTASVRDDADRSRWATAQLALAPLAPGDYVIEMSSGSQRMLSAFRVVP